MKILLFTAILFLLTEESLAQERSSIIKIDRLVKRIDSDSFLVKEVEKGELVEYVSKENDTTWVPFETEYYFKNNHLIKVVSTDFRIEDHNTRAIIYFSNDSLIKIEKGFAHVGNPFVGLKAYFVKDTSIYRDGCPCSYEDKQYFDNNDLETAKYYQEKATAFILSNKRR